MSGNYIIIGMNHNITKLAERDAFIPIGNDINNIVEILKSKAHIKESLLIATSNRIEYYFYSDNYIQIEDFVKANKIIGKDVNIEKLYLHKDTAAIRHIIRVACGLDSKEIGETEITEQISSALINAIVAGTLKDKLSSLFNYAIDSAKKIRKEIGIAPIRRSVPGVIVSFIQHFATNYTPIAIIGTERHSRILCEKLRCKNYRHIYLFDSIEDLLTTLDNISNIDIVFIPIEFEKYISALLSNIKQYITLILDFQLDNKYSIYRESNSIFDLLDIENKINFEKQKQLLLLPGAVMMIDQMTTIFVNKIKSLPNIT